MIVVDTSALIAVVKREAGSEPLERCLLLADHAGISAVSLLEARMVAAREPRGTRLADLETIIAAAAIEIIPFDAAQSDLAFEAFRRFGKGSGHKARLNFGDCAAYALAKSRAAPLLFVGDDFAHVDIAPAVAS
jgi:ribonuclease VapC